jgi:general secretion pathway protein E
MGVERYLLPSALTAIIGQRLVRKLCEACRVCDPSADQWRDKFPEISGSVSELWAARGCERCLGSGCSGRRAIFEALVIEDDFHDPIVEAVSPAHLEQLALSKGMHSMFMDGLRKAGLGLTSVEEVLRVVR